MFKSNWINQGLEFRFFTVLLSLAWAVVLFMPGQPSYAQVSGYATINGTVTDPSGALVIGANVTVTDTDTGVKREIVTDSGGVYSAPYLRVGHYSVTASHPGFKTTTQPGITLTADQKATVNIVLAVGDVKETVEVSTSQTMVETESTALGQVVDSRSVEELPLNGRDPAELTYLVPGGTNSLAQTTYLLSSQGANGMPDEISAGINASRPGGIYYQLDGVYNADNFYQSGNPFPDSDATQEFRVLTNNFDAQYGGASNAVVSVVTRSGTNQWHGSAWEFARNDFFNAADFFSHLTDGLSRHQFGGGVGGPIQKDKQFIFGNFQYTRTIQQVSSSSSYVPTTDMLSSGDFSQAYPLPPGTTGCPNSTIAPSGSGTQLFNHITNTPIACNYIDPSTFDPVALNIEKHFPQVSNASGLVYLTGMPSHQRQPQFTTRYDWTPNSKNSIMGRVFYDNYLKPAQFDDANWPAAAAAGTSWATYMVNYAATWTYTPRSDFVNIVKFGYDKNISNSLSSIDKGWKDVGSSIPEPDDVITVLYSWGSQGPSWVDQNIHAKKHDFNIDDDVSWVKGKNLIVAGVNVMQNYALASASWLADPQVGFTGAVTGSFFSDFLLGDISFYQQGSGDFSAEHGPQVNVYGQDTIKLKPNLTLTLGVRYEPYIVPKPIPSGRVGVFEPGQQSTVYPNAPEDLVYAGDPGVPAGGFNNQYGRVSPRLGIAWQPKFLPNTSIRGAFGMFGLPEYFWAWGVMPPFFPTNQVQFATPNTQNPDGTNKPIPVENPWSAYNPTGGTSPYPSPLPFSYLNGAKPPPTVTFLPDLTLNGIWTPNHKLGWSQNWNLSIQHQFRGEWMVAVDYVGQEGFDIQTPVDINPGYWNSSVSAGSTGPRLNYPQFSAVNALLNPGTFSYNGLHLSLVKRFSHGFQFTSNYAWSKALDLFDQSDTGVGVVRDPFNLRVNHGISTFNEPYLWSNYGVWTLPAFKGHGAFANGALGNWEVSGIFSMVAGVPFSVSPGNGNYSGSGDGTDMADMTGQPLDVHQGPKSHWLNQYFNAAAFTQNAPGTFGDEPKNLMRGPRTTRLDLAVMKNFPFKERYRLQFRAEAFNATNTPEFGPPNVTCAAAPPGTPCPIGGNGIGEITETNPNAKIAGIINIPTNRVMQFGLKFYY